MVLLLRRKSNFRPPVYRYLLLFFLISVGTEFTMTTYVQIYGVAITLGHLSKIGAFYFLYRAVIATCLKDPYVKLEKREREYRTILDHYPYVLSRFDQQLRCLYVNPAHATTFNTPGEQAIGKSWAERGLTGEDFDRLKEKYTQVFKTGQQIEFDTMLPAEHDRARYYHISVVPEKNERGDVESVLAITHDITAQKQSEECFAKAFHINPHIMMITSLPEGRYIDVNEGFIQAAGLPRNTIIQRTTGEFNLWHDGSEQQNINDILNKHGSIFNREVIFRTTSTGLRTGLLSADKITINNLPCVLSVITDITANRQLESQMSRYASLDAVGEMAAALGHEVRNPLTVVRGYLQVLQAKEIGHAYEDQIATMVEELDRANAIISEFLALTKNRETNKAPQNINGIVTALLPLLQADAALADKEIAADLADGLPPLLLDARGIRQMLLNLVRNGLEAMGPHKKLTIRTRRRNAQVLLEIEDQGSGIPPEILAKIGTPFVTTKPHGTGLGLPVCYRVAERHGAQIAVATGDTGTKFTIAFSP